MIKILKKIKSKSDGFTLVESLVSIALILIAVIGPLSLTLNSINIIRENRNRVIASYLAESILEDFRAYRDAFVLSCRDIDISRDDDGNALTGACKAGNSNILISNDVLQKLESGEYTTQNVAWSLFLQNLSSLDDNTEYYLDRSSFNFFNTLSSISPVSNCEYLYLDSINSYSCTQSGSQTEFRRKTSIERLPNNSLRIQVEVIYTKSFLFGLNDKSVKVVDYIYER